VPTDPSLDVTDARNPCAETTLGSDDWWPDGDMMYVTIPEADLKRGRFHRATATLQCF
jgi:hypothetical protein